MRSNKPLTILITGKTGSGKSSLLNGLVGKTVSTEGDKLTSSTHEVSGYGFSQGDIHFLVVDSPGLQDLKQDDKETLDIIKQQLKRTCPKFDLVIYCINMSCPRMEASEKAAIHHLTECFFAAMWKNAIFTLTFANKVEPSPTYKGTDAEWFAEKLREFTTLIQEILVQANVPEKVVKQIPVIPTGYWKPVERIPNPWILPDRPDWFNVFWLQCASRMEEGACIALFKSQESRISTKTLSESQMVGTASERPIYIPPDYSSINSFGIEIPRMRVIAGSLTGSLIGGGFGALLGAAAGPVGAAVVGAAGLATGAVVGGACAAGMHMSVSQDTDFH